MEPLIALLLILIAVGVLAWIAVPLATPVAIAPVAEGDERGELEARRRELLFAIQDLDFELQTGKLSAEDHADLRNRLQVEAVEVLTRLESLGAGDPTAG
ncbi:MAG: hypothetical protein PVF68_11995 [Acidobacteriota bacterium]